MTIRSESLRIEGMQCSGCETTIEDAVKALDGITDVSAHFGTSDIVVRYDDAVLRLSRILAAIEDKGYVATTVGLAAPPMGRTGAWLLSVAKYAVVLTLVGGLVYWGIAIMPGVMAKMHDPQIGYAMLVAVGFLTGFHCIGMCGSFVVSYTTGGEPRTLSSLIAAHALYGAGKTVSYALLGAGFGALGALLTITPFMRGVVAAISGVYLILWGIRMLKLFSGMAWLNWAFPQAVMRGVQSGIRRQPKPLMIGLMSGFLLGCGALQAMYVMAAGTGSPREGALILALFGLGTLGPLLGFGFFAHLLSRRVLNELLRVSGLLVLIMGLLMTDRGMRLTESGYDFATLRARWHSLMNDLSQPPPGDHAHHH
ncbi:urease accessory protein UreH domain-containing protein [Methylotetracoccus oryzae]|uniref:urease accessory protein UreH domain-containing protein n=1 Tax=Methylotetracoccus oryzae TaxID=1919059 RepID=UPI0013A57CED|nr:sulfite exporter TauE/SafE family protein [Methylotetracoccus oryzae]